eukprot:3522692-Rhodomonas_salina.1
MCTDTHHDRKGGTSSSPAYDFQGPSWGTCPPSCSSRCTQSLDAASLRLLSLVKKMGMHVTRHVSRPLLLLVPLFARPPTSLAAVAAFAPSSPLHAGLFSAPLMPLRCKSPATLRGGGGASIFLRGKKPAAASWRSGPVLHTFGAVCALPTDRKVYLDCPSAEGPE